jgi:hypothetical protein
MMEEMMTANEVKTDSKLKELTETIGKTQTELQTVEVSFDAQARKFLEDPATIKSYHLENYY